MTHKNRGGQRIGQVFLSACFENMPFCFTETWLNSGYQFELFLRQCQANLIDRVMKTRDFSNRFVVPKCSFPATQVRRGMKIADKQVTALSHDSRKLSGKPAEVGDISDGER